MEIKIYGFDEGGNFIHILSGDKKLVELSMREGCGYTEEIYPDDGDEYIYEDGWVLKK